MVSTSPLLNLRTIRVRVNRLPRKYWRMLLSDPSSTYQAVWIVCNDKGIITVVNVGSRHRRAAARTMRFWKPGHVAKHRSLLTTPRLCHFNPNPSRPSSHWLYVGPVLEMVPTLLDVCLKMTTLLMLVTVSFSCKFSPVCVYSILLVSIWNLPCTLEYMQMWDYTFITSSNFSLFYTVIFVLLFLT